jgi:hypothetical protein
MCQETGSQVVQQERHDSGVTLSMVQHSNNSNFVVNLFLLHNYQLVRLLVESQMSQVFHTCVEPPAEHESIRKTAAAHARLPKKQVVETEASNEGILHHDFIFYYLTEHPSQDPLLLGKSPVHEKRPRGKVRKRSLRGLSHSQIKVVHIIPLSTISDVMNTNVIIIDVV